MKNPEQLILSGNVRVYQDEGASVTTDTLLLASALRTAPGSVIVDLGCGSGTAALYSSTLNPGCRWIGLDIRYDPLKLMMASRDLQNTPMDIAAVCCGLETVPLAFTECIADAVITNPPYGRAGSVRRSPNGERDRSRRGSELLLYQFIRGAAHLLVPGGEFLIINRPSSLPDIMLGCRASGINPVAIQPVGSPEKPAELIILKGKKGSREDLRILPQTEAESLIRSTPDYTPR
ncbi:MAG: methyltransferase [Candidatus Aegiribacteria sp.]|nr:methyltransferase [Candidatus Aegiribacteria sp.]